MLRRVLSVLRRQPALGRFVLAGTAALGLALACLNPQNDDLPSSRFANPEESEPSGAGNGQTAGDAPPATNTPGAPAIAPAPQDPSVPDSLGPPISEPDPSPGDEGASAEPDAGAAPDAGVPNVAP
jgi:hypothetical protein